MQLGTHRGSGVWCVGRIRRLRQRSRVPVGRLLCRCVTVTACSSEWATGDSTGWASHSGSLGTLQCGLRGRWCSRVGAPRRCCRAALFFGVRKEREKGNISDVRKKNCKLPAWSENRLTQMCPGSGSCSRGEMRVFFCLLLLYCTTLVHWCETTVQLFDFNFNCFPLRFLFFCSPVVDFANERSRFEMLHRMMWKWWSGANIRSLLSHDCCKLGLQLKLGKKLEISIVLDVPLFFTSQNPNCFRKF